GILLPALGAARTSARQMKSSTQLRGIHQGSFTYSQSNKGYFPGLNSDGFPWIGEADGPGHVNNTGSTYRNAGLGVFPNRRFAIMLDENLFTPDYVVSPADGGIKTPPDGTVASPTANVDSTDNLSYAMLAIQFTDSGGQFQPGSTGTYTPSDRGQEWRDTANGQAIMFSDRAISDAGTAGNASLGVIDYHSVWTEVGSEEWRGGVARNDNSVEFATSPAGFTTRYGSAATVDEDELFVEETGAGEVRANARMVLQNGTATLTTQ
ncbi:MAG: hypothetical protein AAGJ38_09935, partial [Planctomycetota bacterium]